MSDRPGVRAFARDLPGRFRRSRSLANRARDRCIFSARSLLFFMRNSDRSCPSNGLFLSFADPVRPQKSENRCIFPCKSKRLTPRLVRTSLHAPPRSPMRTDVSRSLRNSPQFAGVSAGSNADVRSLPLAEVAIASILAAGLWALQTRSWRATELHMKTARFKSTSRASRIGGTTRQEHRGGE